MWVHVIIKGVPLRSVVYLGSRAPVVTWPCVHGVCRKRGFDVHVFGGCCCAEHCMCISNRLRLCWHCSNDEMSMRVVSSLSCSM